MAKEIVLSGDLDPHKMALLVRIPAADMKSIERAGSLQFVTGGQHPMFRFGKQSLELKLKAEQYTRDIYSLDDSTRGNLVARVAYRAKVLQQKSLPVEQDEALLALTNELAAHKKEKEASQTHIAAGFLPIPKNRREAVQQQKKGGILAASKHLAPASPSLSGATPRAPTSAPTDRRSRAMRTALVHYLARGDASTTEVIRITHIPETDATEMLRTMAQLVDGKWKLSDKSFRELDPWRFKFNKDQDRQTAIDRAVKAYDRLRLSKDDKLWQLLLPKNERGQGKILSRLHLNPKPQTSTPRPGSPALSEVYQSSAANTPQLGPSGTPKIGAKKGTNVMKRLLSKDPKKARAVEEAKEKKRKERQSQDDPAESRPAKVQAIAGKNKKEAKSAEFVHSSDEEQVTVKQKPTSHSRSLSTGNAPARAPNPQSQTTKPVAPSRLGAGRLTPQLQQTKPTAVKSRAHISPPKPSIPSPLGAVRPRVTSDVSDRSGISNHRRNNTIDIPRGLGITTTPVRKRHDTVTGMGSNEEIRAALKGSDARPKPGNAKPKQKDDTQNSNTQSRKSSASTSLDTQFSEDRFDGGTSDSSTSFIDTITFNQGVDMAFKFKTEYYPEYARLYDSIAERRMRGETVTDAEFTTLLKQQKRLEQMKREIEAASKRQADGSSS